MGKLDGRVAVVTGATLRDDGLNIGGATGIALAAAGASVVVADIDAAGAERLARHIGELGGRAIARPLDVTLEDSVRDLLQVAVDEFGGLDVLHNNVGAASPDDQVVATLDADVWDATIATNARSTMFGCKHAIPLMVERGGGSIVNTTSGSGANGDMTRVAYGSAKAAVSMLTKYVATQYGKQGVRCNAVLPGLVLSTQARSHVSADVLDMYLRYTLVPRLGEPEDIAHAVAFLASDDASFITGQVIAVDGGLTAQRPYAQESRERGMHSNL
jgi:NAD(P)-dependent dehydrogenase (short-subunit alcohol dehydrogenase family)